MTAATDNGQSPRPTLFSRVRPGWLLFVGVIGLGFFVLDAPREQERPASAGKPGHTVAQQASAPAPASGRRWMIAAGPAPAFDAAPAQRTVAPPAALVTRTAVVEALVAPFRNAQKITPEAAADFKRRLQEMQERGADVVPAIRDFLRSQQNVEFAKMPGGKLAEQPTLRLALMDTLRQIGGAEAIEVSLEQLRITKTPAEIGLLARTLDALAPDVYRDEAMSTVLSALQGLSRTKNPAEVRPLFEALQALGGPEAVAALEQLPHNADAVRYLRNKDTKISPTVGTYALIALASLPDGEGIYSLADLAGDPEVPVAHRTAAPFQLLAQASADQAQAREELVELVKAKQVPDGAWNAVADALAGKHLVFPATADSVTPGKDGANVPGVPAPFVRGFYDDERNVLYEERLVLRTWSAAQIQQQIAFIDALLAATDAPAATQALQRARETLRRRP